ncbi:arsenate reductase family protein [Tamlana sp. I1]|uniref:arsenate reductase family protein n=1 Tax=Tamlana sp. I1 TaxID=2762061 RepID=UPI00188E7BBE|nr:ArsC/Spx/MgsR family protein [Tamlana sp. I1]
MKKVYYLKTCSTCTRILKELNLSSDFILQDIKTEEITSSQLEEMKTLTGNYEVLFSKRAKLYKEMDLKNQDLSERDYKHYILEHYTFLNRPVFIINESIFIGNSKKNIEAVKQKITQSKTV